MIIAGDSAKVGNDDAVIVPAGVRHHVMITGQKPMELFMIFAPPHHPEVIASLDAGETAEPRRWRAVRRSGAVPSWPGAIP